MADDNPYAPPKANLSPYSDYQPNMGTLEPFSIDAVMRRAWRVYKDRMGLCIGVVLTTNGLPSVLSYGAEFAGLGLQSAQAPIGVVIAVMAVLFLASLYFSLLLWAGATVVLLRLAREERVEYTDVFRGGKYVVRLFVSMLILSTAIAGLYLVVFAFGTVLTKLAQPLVGDSPIAQVGAFIFMLIFMFLTLTYFMVRFALLPYVLVDDDCGAIEAIRLTSRLARGHNVEITGILTLATLIGISGILACFVGTIFTMPYALMCYATGYVLLAGNRPRVGAHREQFPGVDEVLDAGPEPLSDEFGLPPDLPHTEHPDDPTRHR